MKTAILLGSSGLVGSFLLTELLNNPAYIKLIVVVRQPLSIQHPKLITLIGNYETLPSLKKELVADDVFICIGTTKKKEPNQKLYYLVDHDYPVLFARLCKENGASSVFVVSAMGANINSKVFYSRTKGEMERDIIALDYASTNIFRPSVLIGKRNEKRIVEQVAATVLTIIQPLLVGELLSKYRGIKANIIAIAMNKSATKSNDKLKYYYWKEMNNMVVQ